MDDPRRNIELKARLKNPAAAKQIAESLADRPAELQSQRDTYFRCNFGRLKLREIDGQRAQLIWYQRPDFAVARQSDYRLVEVGYGRGIFAALRGALGVWAVIQKRRRIYWHRNVRIHLDEVESLGSFLEFEAVLSDTTTELDSRRLLESLAVRFELEDGDLLSGSYSDMLASLAGGHGA